MSLQTFLSNMRARPEHIRKRFAFWTSFGITAVIFVFWLSSFSVTHDVSQATVARAVEKAGTPGQSLVAGVGGFIGDIKNAIFGAKKVIYTEVEVRPGTK